MISITPHVVRAPKITEDDLSPLGVGTEELVRVQGARPSLFGEPEAEPKPPTDAVPTPHTSKPAPGQPPAANHVAPAPPPAPPPAAPATCPKKGRQRFPSPVPNGAEAGMPPAAPSSPTGPPQSQPPGDPASALPEGPVTALFSPPELNLNVTATGTLALVLVGARDVRSIDLSLAFDSRLVQAVDASAGSLLTLDGSSVSSQKALEGSRVRLRFTRATGASGSGVIAAVILRGMAPGTANVSVESLSLETGTGRRSVTVPAPGRVVVVQ